MGRGAIFVVVLTLVSVFWVSVAYHMVKLRCDPIHKSLGQTSDVLDVILHERTWNSRQGFSFQEKASLVPRCSKSSWERG